jgi:hypothetical protein
VIDWQDVMLIRWSIWKVTPASCEMLRYSIASFRRAFGTQAKYVVWTDAPDSLSSLIGSDAELRGYNSFPRRHFDVVSTAPWRKWCPTPRLTPGEPELLVDSDVFLLAKPEELIEFLHPRSPSDAGYLTLQEALPERWTLGHLAPRVPADAPPVNAGLVAQRGDADLTDALLKEFHWWQMNIPAAASSLHDEQGAVVAALCAERHRLSLLPEAKYRIVSPRSNPHVTEPNGMALVHATYPDHPGFSTFRSAIQRYIDIGTQEMSASPRA